VPVCPPHVPYGLSPRSKPGLRRGKPAGKRLSHGTTDLQEVRIEEINIFAGLETNVKIQIKLLANSMSSYVRSLIEKTKIKS
jgi:hypothetical protein